MEVIVKHRSGLIIKYKNVEKIMPAAKSFCFWTLWFKGEERSLFINMNEIYSIDIKGGEVDGPVRSD